MKQVISASLFAASLTAEFARVGIRAATLVVATIRSACKTAGVKVKDVPKEELRIHATAAVAFLVSKGCPPANKEGTAYNARDLSAFISDCVRTAQGQKKRASVHTPDDTEGGEISAAVPKGDGKAALAAMTASENSALPRMRELAAMLVAPRPAKLSQSRAVELADAGFELAQMFNANFA